MTSHVQREMSILADMFQASRAENAGRNETDANHDALWRYLATMNTDEPVASARPVFRTDYFVLVVGFALSLLNFLPVS